MATNKENNTSIGHTVSKNWTPLPRYILRKYNILNEVKKLKGCDSFVDFGCGAGDLACSIAKLGIKGKGYDFSTEAIEVANSIKRREGLNDKQIQFKVSSENIKDISINTDLVLCLDVLEHIKNDKNAFNNLVNTANKYLVISVPCKQRLFGHSDILAGHYRRYDRKDLLALIDHDDIKVVKIIGYGFPFTNLSRIFLEAGAKKNLADKAESEKEDLSKDSGINIFKVSKVLSRINLEAILLPFYWFTKLFNRTRLAEGCIVVLKKK